LSIIIFQGAYSPLGMVDQVRFEILTLLCVVSGASLVHLLMIWGEVSLTHSTAHARVAIWEMTRGRYKSPFWFGIVLSLLGGIVPWVVLILPTHSETLIPISVGIGGGALLALIGLMLFEHAYVQAGQSVPLA
jgi:hypothetical protein